MKVNYNGRELEVIVNKQPFAEYVDFYDVDGELYASLGTNFSDNLLLAAIWVQVGGIQEELAAIIPNILKKTDRFCGTSCREFTTRYNMYEII